MQSIELARTCKKQQDALAAAELAAHVAGVKLAEAEAAAAEAADAVETKKKAKQLACGLAAYKHTAGCRDCTLM